jgi:hypothetical protein
MDALQGANIVKLKKSPRLTWYTLTEMMNNERMPKQIVTTRIEEIIKTRRTRIRWPGEVQGDLKVIRQREWRAVVTHREEWRTVMEAKIHDGLHC